MRCMLTTLVAYLQCYSYVYNAPCPLILAAVLDQTVAAVGGTAAGEVKKYLACWPGWPDGHNSSQLLA